MGSEGSAFTHKLDNFFKRPMPGGIGPSKPLPTITLHTSGLRQKHGQDSQSPLIEECFEFVYNSSQLQYAEARVGENQKQGKDGGFWDNNLVQCDSNICVRASQVHGINLHVDLNPSAVRRNIRSQQLEASVNSEGDDIAEYIIASQEQEQNEIDKEVQKTILAGNSLGIKFGDAGIKRMKKMIENEAKVLKASLKYNSFAPLTRDE
ncbi:hypothetical protein RHSIM_RhsimUnG0177800 [Rhododendron simsii]|uniref:Uncharacterized protein n=1 Tax=Rhododendron simsii TaxID=118357 RepID=A0A834FV56_RHOSS|nr:hypothetical protein RHSIM_RhsimUnG0177800 [Rhododendron simsii]